jgi:hypothetical protein
VEPDGPAPEVSSAPPGLPLATAFKIHPKSLPPIHFGHPYRVRAPVADLAGNARPLVEGDDKTNPEASPPETFCRFEPVAHPANALVDGAKGLERPDDGESMARMAIRSFNGLAADNTVPEVLNQSGRAFETRLDRDSFPNGEIRAMGEHGFGGTHFRGVSYVIEAPTRFPEFMPPSIRQQPDQIKVLSAPAVALVPNASAPPCARSAQKPCRS